MSFVEFNYPVVIREPHLDTFGHVNNATYLVLLEEARWEFITSRGYGLDKIRQTGMGPTVLEWNIKFLKELRLRQKITIQSQTLTYERKVGILRQDILNEAGETCFEARMTFGLFDTTARKLVMPTDEWLYAIGKS